MTTEVTIIETDNPIFTILTEEAVTDVLFVDGTGPRGDKGDKGDPGDLIRPDPSFTYDTEGNLTNVDYPDGSFKEFTYTAGVLTSITYELGAASGTRTFVYTGDVLERIEDE